MTASADAPRSTNAPAITPEMVAAFLEEREGRPVSAMTQLRQGGWSSAWSYRVGERREVIRFSHLGDDFERDRLASRWSSPLVPVPRVIALGDAFGGAFAITKWADGVGLDSLNADGFRRVLPSLFATMDAMRELAPPGTGYGGWDAKGNGSHATWPAFLRSVGEDDAGGRLGNWRKLLAASPAGIDRFDRALAFLDAVVDRLPSPRHVVHNDLINANVLVAGDRITAVLDWGCGLTGDFLFDLAWFAFYRPWYAQWQAVDVVAGYRSHAEVTGLALPMFDLRLACCQICLGLGDVRHNAFMRNWANAEWTLSRIDAVIGGMTGDDTR